MECREDAAAVLWLHGGGFVWGNLDQAESHMVALRLAESGRRVRTVDYRLAPRFPWAASSTVNHFPAGLDDVVDAGRALAAEHGRVVLGGASAGACLAVTGAQRLSGVAGLLLCYGLYHAELPPLPESVRDSLRGLAGYRQLSPPAVHRLNVNYVGREDLLDSGAFPGGGDLTGLPPALLLDADHDTLRASGEAFAAELAAAGVPVSYTVVPNSWHGYLNRPQLNGFRFALDAMTAWLDAHMPGEVDAMRHVR
ncbi:alpha/beta hydrolase [Nocardia arizonensis]|uniref:alpha/beta hydrolase n=1 Tax=Nocardia arizonensis TaxID=1141647 RepID=UPI00195162E1|nr:alpha/beta fold hydrolase [Nocardia arizonensis]